MKCKPTSEKIRRAAEREAQRAASFVEGAGQSRSTLVQDARAIENGLPTMTSLGRAPRCSRCGGFMDELGGCGSCDAGTT
jgi:hypothetical protein